MRSWWGWLAGPMALLAAACATMSPEQRARQDILWEAATGCARGTGTIKVDQIDHLDRVHYTLWQGGQQEVPAFLDCYQRNAREKLAAAGLLRTVQSTPDRPASVPRPAPREAVSPAQPAPAASAPVAQPAPSTARTSPPPPDSPGAPAAPRWAVGDEWEFRARSPRWTGTFVWSVVREDSVDGVPYYVVRSGENKDVYYRRNDHAFHMVQAAGVVETRITPPQIRYVWPLTVGRSWEQTYTIDKSPDPDTGEVTRICQVEAEEAVTVPAGAFTVLRIVCRDKRTHSVLEEKWYAPAAKHWVKDRTHQPWGLRERELIAFKLASPAPAMPARPAAATGAPAPSPPVARPVDRPRADTGSRPAPHPSAASGPATAVAARPGTAPSVPAPAPGPQPLPSEEARTSPTPRGALPGAPSGIEAQLDALDDLKNRGRITAAEYATMRRRLVETFSFQPGQTGSRSTASISPEAKAAMPSPRVDHSWLIGRWEGQHTGTDVGSDVTSFEFHEREGRIRWTMSRRTAGLTFPRSLSASGVVRTVTEDGVELEGAYDLTSQGGTAGNSVTYSLKRNGDRLDGVAQGAGAPQLRVSVKRTR